MLAPGWLHHTVYTVLASHKQTNKGGEAPVPCWPAVAFHWIWEFLIFQAKHYKSAKKLKRDHWVSSKYAQIKYYYFLNFFNLFSRLGISNKGGWLQFLWSALDNFTLLLKCCLTAYRLLNIGRRHHRVEHFDSDLMVPYKSVPTTMHINLDVRNMKVSKKKNIHGTLWGC